MSQHIIQFPLPTEFLNLNSVVAVVFILVGYQYFAAYYRRSAREMKRLGIYWPFNAAFNTHPADPRLEPSVTTVFALLGVALWTWSRYYSRLPRIRSVCVGQRILRGPRGSGPVLNNHQPEMAGYPVSLLLGYGDRSPRVKQAGLPRCIHGLRSRDDGG